MSIILNIKNLKKMKKMAVDKYTNEDHMIHGSCNIRCNRQKFSTFWAIFCLLPPYGPRKSKFLKKWKKHLKRLSFYKHKWQSYDVWFLRYGPCDRQNFLSFWTIFCLFTPLKTQKIKILKKFKKVLEILSFYTSVP